MRRRNFLTLLCGMVAAWPLAARSQQGIRHLGVLQTLFENDPNAQLWHAALQQELEHLGWSTRRNLSIEYRFAGGDPDRFQPLARELIALRPDVILSSSGPATTAVKRETQSIPIIFTSASDPIGAGLVESLSRPGGNITGFLLYEASVTGKWMAMLKEIAPGVTRVGLLGNPRSMPYDFYWRAAETVAPSLGFELVAMRIRNADEIERAIELFARAPNGGLVLPANNTTTVNRDLIIALAARHHLPAVYADRLFVKAGGLMSYDEDRVDMWRQAATYVDRILRGAKPGDLPVQAPTKYATTINLRVAKALGLTVPDLMLVRADEIIE